MRLDTFHKDVQAAFLAGEFARCDALLAQCPDEHGECSVCAWICCPHRDTFHFHHDGCPSCAERPEYTQEQVDAMNKGKDDDAR